MVLFSRADSKGMFLPLALRAYDTTLNQPLWDQIGYSPIGQIVIDHRALLAALAEETEVLRREGTRTHRAIDNLSAFVRAIENDAARNGSFFGWVAVNAQTSTAAVTFRGTHGFDEWLKDALIVPVPYPFGGGTFGLVHAGFLIVYKSVRKSTLDLLAQISLVKYSKLFICGHSLGAAVATLSAPDVYESIGHHTLPAVRSFASPRPADFLYSKTLIGRGMSVLTHRNRFDLVPNLPIVPYFHTDTVALIGGGELFKPKVSHDLTASYKPGLEALTSDDSAFGELPEHPYCYTETP